MNYKVAGGCSKYCLGILYSGLVSETKHFKQTMKFIDNANKPIAKIAKKTNLELGTFQKDIVKKINTTSEQLLPPTEHLKKQINSNPIQKKPKAKTVKKAPLHSK